MGDINADFSVDIFGAVFWCFRNFQKKTYEVRYDSFYVYYERK